MPVISIYPEGSLKKDLEKLAKNDRRSLNSYILSILSKHCKVKKI